MPKAAPGDVKPLLTKLVRVGAKAARFWAGGFTATEIADLAEAARED